MNVNDTTAAPGCHDWDMPNLALLWDARTEAIVAGAQWLDAVPGPNRAPLLAGLRRRVRAAIAALEDEWLVLAAFYMAEDIYRSCSGQFRWDDGTQDYLAATAGVFNDELNRRRLVLHYVVDSIEPALTIERLTDVAAVFTAAGFAVTGPQLAALDATHTRDRRPGAGAANPADVCDSRSRADNFVARCHQDRRCSAYFNLCVGDTGSATPLTVALSQRNQPGTIVVFRDQPPVAGSVAQLCPPSGVRLADLVP